MVLIKYSYLKAWSGIAEKNFPSTFLAFVYFRIEFGSPCQRTIKIKFSIDFSCGCLPRNRNQFPVPALNQKLNNRYVYRQSQGWTNSSSDVIEMGWMLTHHWDGLSSSSFVWSPITGIQSAGMMTSWNGNIFRVTGHLCGKFTGPRWIPHTKASDAELWCFLWYVSEKKTVE